MFANKALIKEFLPHEGDLKIPLYSAKQVMNFPIYKDFHKNYDLEGNGLLNLREKISLRRRG